MRQAMAHAIDFEPILHDLMGELFIPAGMIVARGSMAMGRSWTFRSLTTPKKPRLCWSKLATRTVST